MQFAASDVLRLVVNGWATTTNLQTPAMVHAWPHSRLTCFSYTLQERKLAHELAEHYGLTTQSLGAEPQRHIELFKTPRSSIPGRRAP